MNEAWYTIIWYKTTEEMPPLGEVLLIRTFSGRVSVSILKQIEGVIVSDNPVTHDKPCVSYAFYPGGLPLVNATHWARIPTPDGVAAKL